MASTDGSSTLTTAQSPACWFSKMRAFAAAARLNARMTIEVVGREVQQDGNPRMEGLNPFELEAARFDDVQGLGRRRLDLRGQWRADIAADRHRASGRFENASSQFGRRRFALRPRDGDDSAAKPA